VYSVVTDNRISFVVFSAAEEKIAVCGSYCRRNGTAFVISDSVCLCLSMVHFLSPNLLDVYDSSLNAMGTLKRRVIEMSGNGMLE